MISYEHGITTIISKLNSLYKKDELNEKFEVLQHLERYRRSTETEM